MLRFALVLLVLLPSAWRSATAQAPPSVVRAAVAELKQLQNHHRVTGSLRAVARGNVAALEEGRIIEITVREGATVRQGNVIARIDARRLKAQHAELTATLQASVAHVEQRNLELRQTKRDLDRSQQLVTSRATSVEEHQHRETSASVAEAQLNVAEKRLAEIEGQLALLNVRLADVVVRAPYDGIVVERHAQPGEWIHPGEPFVTLVSSGEIEAWLDVPERFAQTLGESGLKVVVQGVEEPIPMRLAKRVPDVHSRTRTFPLVLTLDDQAGRLAPGMSVDAWLPVGPRKRWLTVPKNAVIRNGRAAYVYKIVEQDGQSTAAQSPVQIAFETGERGRIVRWRPGRWRPGDRGRQRAAPARGRDRRRDARNRRGRFETSIRGD
jgi:RND family efflux transporter MFP subunit